MTKCQSTPDRFHKDSYVFKKTLPIPITWIIRIIRILTVVVDLLFIVAPIAVAVLCLVFCFVMQYSVSF